ncbi:MAG TPA: DNA internalization-related competence protein ComEC/Rec2 [Polyangiaceae bacterium]|nr:DNA internalization-related competence protein ComEC/Rec2 [Polyangiaceae bacterium]
MWIDPVLLACLAALAGAILPFATSASLVGAACALCLLAPRVHWRLLLVLVGCFSCGAGRAAWQTQQYEAARVSARESLGAPQRCEVTGRVESSPLWSGERLQYALRVERAECENGTVPDASLVRLGGGPADLARGDRMLAIVDLAPVELWKNPDLSDPTPSAARRGVLLSGATLSAEIVERAHSLTSLVDRARAHVRARILASFAPAVQAMARALVLGENDLDDGDALAFRKSGLSHMLAVSGTHLVFAVVSIVNALRALLVRVRALSERCDVGRLAHAIGIALALGYADFAGGSGSAERAAWMLSAAFAARALGRPVQTSRSLALSLGVGWLLDPLVSFDLSFLLSAAATVGLLALSKPLAAPVDLVSSKLLRGLGRAMATSLAAMLPCTPLLLLFGDGLTLVGVFANVVAAPLGETLALPLCLTHALCSALPPLEAGLAHAASGALFAVRWIALRSAEQTYLNLPLPAPNAFQIALVLVLGQSLLLGGSEPVWRRRVHLLVGVLGLCSIELAQRAAGSPSGKLRFTALSVGQGDASLLDLPDGKLMLIDGGGAASGGADPGTRVVLPTLAARRRSRIDFVVLSHPHPDHAAGLAAVLANVEVGELWDTAQGRAESAGPSYAAVLRLARERRIPIREPKDLCGRPQAFGALRVRVLAPCPSFTPGRSANDNSFVLRLEFGSHALMFMGDAEHAAEMDLMQSGAPLQADVLKIGHHGSRTSSTAAFLERVHPRVATISCGARNRFGHPAPEVLERLSALATYTVRTDWDGGARIESDGARLTLERDPLLFTSGN